MIGFKYRVNQSLPEIAQSRHSVEAGEDENMQADGVEEGECTSVPAVGHGGKKEETTEKIGHGAMREKVDSRMDSIIQLLVSHKKASAAESYPIPEAQLSVPLVPFLIRQEEVQSPHNLQLLLHKLNYRFRTNIY